MFSRVGQGNDPDGASFDSSFPVSGISISNPVPYQLSIKPLCHSKHTKQPLVQYLLTISLNPVVKLENY